MPHSFEEFGVIVDRTDKGLGHALLATTRDKSRAEKLAEDSTEKAVVKVRLAVYSDWEDLDADD